VLLVTTTGLNAPSANEVCDKEVSRRQRSYDAEQQPSPHWQHLAADAGDDGKELETGDEDAVSDDDTMQASTKLRQSTTASCNSETRWCCDAVNTWSNASERSTRVYYACLNEPTCRLGALISARSACCGGL